MEKILLAIDAVNLHMPSLDFACYLGRLTRSKVTGVFLENLVGEERPVLKTALDTLYAGADTTKTSEQYMEKREMIDKHIAIFREACENRSVSCSVHRDRGVPAREIINESRYADLLIIDAATSFNRKYEGVPTGFVKDILEEAECPVIIAPESFEGIDEIVFAYNSSKSSAFAIKQFTYLLPQLKDKKATVLQVNEKGAWADQDKYNFKEWMQNHYSALGFEVLKGDTDDKLFDYLFKKENIFLVMGAYGRGALSRFFKHSQADRLIKTVTQPIFISHF